MAGNYLLHAIGFGGDVIPAINKLGIDAKGTLKAEASSGNVYPEHAHLTAQDPVVDFETAAIGTAWRLCGLAGESIADLSGYLTLYQKKLASGGGIAAGASHRKLTARKGIVIPQQLTVSTREDASLTYQAIVTYDGTNEPYTISSSVSVPAVAVDSERYGIGTMQIGSVTIDKLNSWTLDFGIETFIDNSGSAIWPVEVHIKKTAPRLTVQITDAEVLAAANIPLTGKAAAHADTTFYLRRRAGAGFVANGSSVHVAITMAGQAQVTQPFDASGSDPGQVALELAGKYDGSNAPVLITPDTTIS